MVNRSNKITKNILLVNYKLFLFILLLVPLYLFNNKYLKLIGGISIVSLLMLSLFNIIPKMDKIKINKIWLWYILYLSYSILMLVRTPTIRAMYSYLLQMALLLFVTILSTITLDDRIINKIFKWGKFVYFLLFIPSFIIALEGGRGAFGKFDILYSPVIYKLMLPCTFFFIAKSKQKLLKILFFSLIYLRMVERTSAIVLLIIYFTYILLKKLKRSQKLYNLFFLGIFMSVIGFVFLYVQLQYTSLGYLLNDLFRQYTGGNFFSGRNYIWQVAFNYIKEKPFIGYGIDNGVLTLSEITISSHNTYIHILLQGGMIGLFIFFMFMYSIWKSYFNNLNNDIVATAAAYLIGILIFINFEVTMIGNSTTTAIFLWLILGIGLIESNNERYNNTKV